MDTFGGGCGPGLRDSNGSMAISSIDDFQALKGHHEESPSLRKKLENLWSSFSFTCRSYKAKMVRRAACRPGEGDVDGGQLAASGVVHTHDMRRVMINCIA